MVKSKLAPPEPELELDTLRRWAANALAGPPRH
jgi:hypothetical protein